MWKFLMENQHTEKYEQKEWESTNFDSENHFNIKSCYVDAILKFKNAWIHKNPLMLHALLNFT
jgi:hypothetical protein